MLHKPAVINIVRAVRRFVMCEYDDKRGDCEDKAEAKKKQDDEDLFDLFILNEFFDL